MGFESYGQTILVKCALLGDAAVGKTAIAQALVSDGTQFPKNYSMTTSLKLNQKTMEIPNSDDEVCLILFDLGADFAKNFWLKNALKIVPCIIKLKFLANLLKLAKMYLKL